MDLAASLLTTGLRELHEHHVWRVNAAVARGAGQDALAGLSDDYADVALRALTAAAAPGSSLSR